VKAPLVLDLEQQAHGLVEEPSARARPDATQKAADRVDGTPARWGRA